MANAVEWINCDIECTVNGLYLNGLPIVEKWENAIQEQLAYLTCQASDRIVLEIGFGLGMAAQAIQSLKPRKHYIIEVHKKIAKHAIDTFNGTDSPPVVIRAAWEEILPHFRIHQFDAIIFDSYPLADMPFDGGVKSTYSYVESFLVAAQDLLKPQGYLGFLDFSGLLSDYIPFSKLIHNRFSSVQFVPSPISPPPGCSYANGPTGYVAILKK